MNAIDLVVTGIIKTEGLEFDFNTVLIDLKLAQEFSETDDINDIVLRGDISPIDLNNLEELGVETISYLDELFDLIVVTKLKVKVVIILSCIILLMSGVGIVNTMLMAMLERQKEIGILMANGLKPKEIMKLFLLEGSILGGIGSGIGFILGGSLVYYYELVGIPIPSLAHELSTTIPLSDRIYGHFDLKLNLFFFISGVIIATIVSFYPAYKATQLNPIDVIRG
ncbi:FtsX-like permease family protein [Psychrilyobacter sp.]|uniref:ABC transporter permease n=1 Tax=Psychrilyobacter sp. TaxID=2586924 RepID=UPI00301A4D2B